MEFTTQRFRGYGPVYKKTFKRPVRSAAQRSNVTSFRSPRLYKFARRASLGKGKRYGPIPKSYVVAGKKRAATVIARFFKKISPNAVKKMNVKRRLMMAPKQRGRLPPELMQHIGGYLGYN